MCQCVSLYLHDCVSVCFGVGMSVCQCVSLSVCLYDNWSAGYFVIEGFHALTGHLSRAYKGS